MTINDYLLLLAALVFVAVWLRVIGWVMGE